MKTVSSARLSAYTTFQLGGRCRFLVECAAPEELIEAVQTLNKEKTPFVLMGGGSNIVVSDHGLDCAVVRYVSFAPLIERRGDDVTVSAGSVLDDLAVFCVDEGLEGLNYASGIPGTVGGAVVGNAGAWGRQVGDVLKSAVILDKEGRPKTVGPEYFRFSYRHSALKETDEIVVEVTFALKDGGPVALAQERAEILRQRAEKHPEKDQPCAGSFFRNIEATSKAQRRQAAGGFLEDAGAKAFRIGGAYVFEKHANIIIKGPGATSQDVHDLHLKMMEAVKTKFGLQLVREVRFAGKFSNTSEAQEAFW